MGRDGTEIEVLSPIRVPRIPHGTRAIGGLPTHRTLNGNLPTRRASPKQPDALQTDKHQATLLRSPAKSFAVTQTHYHRRKTSDGHRRAVCQRRGHHLHHLPTGGLQHTEPLTKLIRPELHPRPDLGADLHPTDGLTTRAILLRPVPAKVKDNQKERANTKGSTHLPPSVHTTIEPRDDSHILQSTKPHGRLDGRYSGRHTDPEPRSRWCRPSSPRRAMV
jgi:hypothetical protein